MIGATRWGGMAALALGCTWAAAHEGCLPMTGQVATMIPAALTTTTTAAKASTAPLFAINAGLTGPWFDPATAGQGFFLDVLSEPPALSFAWFTYGLADAEEAPKQRWLVGVGGVVGDTAITDLFLSEGGRFVAPPEPPAEVVGEVRFRFESCTRGVVEYRVLRSALGDRSARGADQISGRIELQRLTPDRRCAALAAAPKQGFAVVGATLLPMDSDRSLPAHTVVVQDDRIVAIRPDDSAPLDSTLQVIDGRGRWLLPGLMDFHTHEAAGVDGWPDDTGGNLLMSLANGITSLANMGDFTGALPAYRARVRSGELPGPELYIGRLARGAGDGGNALTFARNVDEARALVAAADAEGYDFIKNYSAVTRSVFEVLIAEGGARGLPVLGHANNTVPIGDLLSGGLAMLVHVSDFGRSSALGGLNSAAEVEAMANLMRQQGAYLGGTLATSELIRDFGLDAIAGRDPWQRVLAQEGIAFMDDRAVDAWVRMLAFRSDIRSATDRRAFFQSQLQWLRTLHARGVVIIAGSDSIGIPGMVPGFTLLRELELFREAGLDGYATLATATRNPGRLIAEHLRPQERVGTIEIGARADLVLLDADPRQSLRTLRDPAGVMAAGRWYPRGFLQQQLELLRSNR